MNWPEDFIGRVIQGDCLEVMRQMPDASINCCVTSPPYWGLRDYDVECQIGLEQTPEQYVAKMVKVFREVRRVIRDDGTLWLNLGDCFAGSGKGPAGDGIQSSSRAWSNRSKDGIAPLGSILKLPVPDGLKPKDLVGIPWRVAFSLQADGWYLRSDIIWSKPNPMPESVLDRPTRSHEYIFLMSKSSHYFYNSEAIKEPGKLVSIERLQQDGFYTQKGGPKDPHSGNRSHRKVLENLRKKIDKQRGHSRRHAGFNDRWDHMSKEEQCSMMRNKRSVWEVSTHAFHGPHFATFPEDLIKPCILAGVPENGIVLDPFIGSGTTALVASKLDKNFVGIDINPQYCEIARKRVEAEKAQFKIF